MLLNINKKILLFSFSLFAFIFLIFSVFAQDYYKVDPGESVEVDAHDVCMVVSNETGSPSTFIPTKSEYEWYLFRFNLPDHISLGDCIKKGTLRVRSRFEGSLEPGVTITAPAWAGGVEGTEGETEYTVEIQSGMDIVLRARSSHPEHDGSTFERWEGCRRTDSRFCTVSVEEGEEKIITARYVEEESESEPEPEPEPECPSDKPHLVDGECVECRRHQDCDPDTERCIIAGANGAKGLMHNCFYNCNDDNECVESCIPQTPENVCYCTQDRHCPSFEICNTETNSCELGSGFSP